MRLLLLLTMTLSMMTACQSSQTLIQTEHIKDPIERVRLAYKIDLLHAANTIRLEADIRQEYPDHEYTPDFHDMSAQRTHHIIDIKNNAGSSEYLSLISNSYYHGRSVLVDGTSQFIIYPSNMVQQAEKTDFISEYGAVIRSSDTMLALWLDKYSETARIAGEEMWLGELHDKVVFDFPNSPELTIFVQKNTGYIAKMSRVVGDGISVFYTFSYHRLHKGIPHAQEHSVYAGSERLFYSFNKRLVIDGLDDDRAFEIESDLSPEPARVEQSIMTAEVIAKNIYHVGQNESYTTFIKTSNGLVAFGVENDFKDRIRAYREKTADRSPLNFAIVANHHNVRMAGVREALATGATILITPAAKNRIKTFLNGISVDRIESVPSSKSIGALTIYNIPTSTAIENLVAYERPSGSVIQTSHYAAPFISAPLFAELTGFTLLKSLAPLNLSPNIIISTESRRSESWQVFEEAVAEFVQVPCARKRRICEGWE